MNSRYLDETLDYKLVVQGSVASKGNGHAIYAIVNKETDVVEAETSPDCCLVRRAAVAAVQFDSGQ